MMRPYLKRDGALHAMRRHVLRSHPGSGQVTQAERLGRFTYGATANWNETPEGGPAMSCSASLVARLKPGYGIKVTEGEPECEGESQTDG